MGWINDNPVDLTSWKPKKSPERLKKSKSTKIKRFKVRIRKSR